jgi:hypothetical protein
MEHTSRPQPLVIARFFACLAPTIYSNVYSFGRHDNLVFSGRSIDRTGNRANALRVAKHARGATVVESRCRGRHTPWSMFLKAHWKAMAASNFFTVEVWSRRGLISRLVCD